MSYYVMTYLNEWRQFKNWSREQIENYQDEKIQILLLHSKNNIEYYKSLNATKISEFPVMTKDILNENREKLINKNIKKKIKRYTSGSTGRNTMIYVSKQELSQTMAIQLFWWELAGYNLGNPLLQTGIDRNRSFLKKLKDYLTNTNYILAYNTDPDYYKKILLRLNKNKEWVIGGYASSLNILAEVSIKNELSIKVKSVISWGDKLFEHYKRNINNAFTPLIYDTYGCGEGLMMAFKFDNDYYYIMSPHVYIEIVDDNLNPLKNGEIGNILVTRIDGYTMPLIRYRIGDLGILLPKSEYPKNASLNFPLLKKIIGREGDVIRTIQGKILVVHVFTGILEYFPEIIQFQIFQNSFEKILIKYIPSKKLTINTIEKIKKEIHSETNTTNELIIEFKRVEEISSSPSGKPQIIHSTFNKTKLCFE